MGDSFQGTFILKCTLSHSCETLDQHSALVKGSRTSASWPIDPITWVSTGRRNSEIACLLGFAAERDLRCACDVRLSPVFTARTIPRRHGHATPHHGQVPLCVAMRGDWESGCAR